MVDRKVDWKYLVMTVVITSFMFGAIFLAGIQLNDFKTDDLRNDMRKIEVEQRSQSLGLQLTQNVEGGNCESMQRWVNDSVPKLENLRKKVAAYENSNKLGGEEETSLKKRYMNLLIQNLIEVRTLEKNCESGIVDIIYLYADDSDCETCQDQATILTHLRNEYEGNLAVYPLDTELDMKHINFIESYHDVNEYPVLIVDGEVYRGFQSKERLGEIIEGEMNQTSALNQTMN